MRNTWQAATLKEAQEAQSAQTKEQSPMNTITEAEIKALQDLRRAVNVRLHRTPVVFNAVERAALDQIMPLVNSALTKLENLI